MTKEITTVIEREVSPVVLEAQKLTIKNEKGMAIATETLSKLNILSDKVTKEKEKITVPAQAVLTAERKRWAPIEKPLKEAIDLIRGKMSEYQTELTREARAEEDRIASRIAPGKGNLSVQSAVNKMAAVDRPAEKIVTDSGSLKFREIPVVKVVDKSKIPLEYMIVDERMVLGALSAGQDVPGCQLDTKMVPINNR